MIISTNNLMSITDANKNFSNVVKYVEKNGYVIILKNNKPKYIVSKFEKDKTSMGDDDMIELVARRILSEHKKAFEELAKK